MASLFLIAHDAGESGERNMRAKDDGMSSLKSIGCRDQLLVKLERATG